MYLEIVSPETTLFSGEVDSVAVPGVNGKFEMLTNHAPVVSILTEGDVKISGKAITLEDDVAAKFTKIDNAVLLPINSGTIEMKDNKLIILAD